VGDREHWDHRYETVGAESVSWFEPHPEVSIHLLDELGVGVGDSLIDVGGGASSLVDALVRRGHQDVTVLDLSSVALDRARDRLGVVPVVWINADLLTWRPTRRWDVWHDRAALHFLTDDVDRRAYAARMRESLQPGGAFVIGAFAEDGPTECSGLPVRRYHQRDFVDLLGDVDVVELRRGVHRTPTGAEQPFNWIAGRLGPATRTRR
jgi:SAM-dependent methyltransferase